VGAALGDPQRRCIVEADVVEGVRAVGLGEFAGLHVRVCRPVVLGTDEIAAVVEHAVGRLGQRYDLKNIVDLVRWLLPTPPVPTRWRRRLIALGSGDPTRAICSTLVAEAFQSVRYPILPSIERRDRQDPLCPDCVDEILHVRHHSLFVPRDFDVSPYFQVVKPTLEAGFDPHRLTWAPVPPPKTVVHERRLPWRRSRSTGPWACVDSTCLPEPGTGRHAMKPVLSIVMPALNEAAGIEAALAPLQPLRARGVEILLADGGSTDGTARLAAPWVDSLTHSARGRALQMNAGAAAARADALLFLHADTLLPPQADGLVQQALAGGACWGRFDVHIVGRPRMLRVVAAAMNLRSRLSGIATGDQAIFVTRAAFERVGRFPAQPLMEDIELSRRLKRIGPPACLRECVRTSGRRWEQRGVWRTIVLMCRLRWRYWRGESAARLAEAYR
jgi:rSAM/selenodomain-associated transferase 2